MTLKTAIWVLLGGGFGSLLRFWLGTMIPFSVTEFAWATFMVNMAGCFAIGGCYPFFSDPVTKAALIGGILGGFTTFSGLGLELFRYAEAQQWKMAAIYGLTSLILGTILVWLGYRAGLWIK